MSFQGLCFNSNDNCIECIDCLGRLLFLPIYEHWRSFHLLLSAVPFLDVLKILSHKAFTYVVSVTYLDGLLLSLSYLGRGLAENVTVDGSQANRMSGEEGP